VLTSREEHKLRVCENGVLGRISGRKRAGRRGEWRKVHYKELNDLYSSANIIRAIKSRRMIWAGHVARMGRGAQNVLVGKPERKILLSRPRHNWEVNILLKK